MYLERLLQINMATLAVFGAILLGMGQRNESPPLLVALAAATAVWLTDITGWFRLGRRVANVLMLIAAVVSLREIIVWGYELRTMGLAWFLTYLQIILLFQKKDERVYWMLVSISLLQVVVATLFNQGVWFGVLLAMYMVVGFSAMTLLLLYRQWEHCHVQARQLAKATVGGDSSRRLNPGKSGTPAIGVASSDKSPPQSPPSRPRWPLSPAQPIFICSPGGGSRAGVCRELFARLGQMGFSTLGITLAIFLIVPRFGQVTWRGTSASALPMVGYSDKVALGELGRIIEDPAEVMRVQLYDASHDAPIQIAGNVYLHGAILTKYEQGEWQSQSSRDTRVTFLRAPESPPPPDLVSQEITIEPLEGRELFYVAPFVPLKSTYEMSFDHFRQRLLRWAELCDCQFWYRLGTTAIVGNLQRPLNPVDRSDSLRQALTLPQGDGSTSLPRLTELANRWMAESQLPAKDHLGRARYLAGRLATSEKFQYSLEGPDRNRNIDPIEDFVSEHPQGHCEYFATALTLMLRTQGIPARLVIGYKCDEWNSAGGYYQVRQLHAHTWVEAYLRPEEIPEDLIHGKDYWQWTKRGAWLRLDPTPASARAEPPADVLTPLRNAMDRIERTWSGYVVALDFERQRDAIYKPVANAVRGIWEKVSDGERWRALWQSALSVIDFSRLSGVPVWLAATIATVLVAGVAALVGWLFWLLGRRLRQRWALDGSGRHKARRSQIGFYRRFETLLARRGLVRAASQTQREFAATAASHFAQSGREPSLTAVPALIVDAFYRVRFGGQRLDKHEAQAVEHALGQLKATI